MKNLIVFVLMAILLTSCGHYRDGQSVWAEGLWLLPWITGLAAVWFYYVAWKARESGSNKIIKGKLTNEEGGKMPYTQIGQFWFGVGLTLATIGIIIWVNLEK